MSACLDRAFLHGPILFENELSLILTQHGSFVFEAERFNIEEIKKKTTVSLFPLVFKLYISFETDFFLHFGDQLLIVNIKISITLYRTIPFFTTFTVEGFDKYCTKKETILVTSITRHHFSVSPK